MARLPRLSVAGQTHLMIQRVHQGQSPFVDPADRRAYLLCLAEAASRHGVAILGYGLAAAEVRLLATPAHAQALGQMVQFIGRRFVAAFNRRHQRRGALWEGRFRATVIEPVEYFLPCLRYVESAENTKHQDAVVDDTPWSSAEHHAGLRADSFVTEHPRFWSLGNTPFEREAAYRSSMEQAMSPAQTEGIAIASLHGWVLGSADFVRTLGAGLDRRLRPLPAGRPARRIEHQLARVSDPD